MTIKFAIITCSDTRTLETDEAGQKLEQLIAERGWECVRRVVEMDERPFIAGALIDACDNTDADIVLTCGGSGLSLRDVTPEATRDVADRVIFMADGLIVEEGTPEEVFTSNHERTQSFLGRYGDGYGSLKN